jgi:hypothetical protein
VLWGELSGEEHLTIYGHVKGLPFGKVRVGGMGARPGGGGCCRLPRFSMAWHGRRYRHMIVYYHTYGDAISRHSNRPCSIYLKRLSRLSIADH